MTPDQLVAAIAQGNFQAQVMGQAHAEERATQAAADQHAARMADPRYAARQHAFEDFAEERARRADLSAEELAAEDAGKASRNAELLTEQQQLSAKLNIVFERFGIDEERSTPTTAKLTQSASGQHGGHITKHSWGTLLPWSEAKYKTDTVEHVTNFVEVFSNPILLQAANPDNPDDTTALYAVFSKKMGAENRDDNPLDSFSFEVYKAPYNDAANEGPEASITLGQLKHMGAQLATEWDDEPIAANVKAVTALQAQDIRKYTDLKGRLDAYDGVDIGALPLAEQKKLEKLKGEFSKAEHGLANELIDPKLSDTISNINWIMDNFGTERNPAITDVPPPAPTVEPGRAPVRDAAENSIYTTPPDVVREAAVANNVQPPVFHGQAPAATTPEQQRFAAEMAARQAQQQNPQP